METWCHLVSCVSSPHNTVPHLNAEVLFVWYVCQVKLGNFVNKFEVILLRKKNKSVTYLKHKRNCANASTNWKEGEVIPGV